MNQTLFNCIHCGNAAIKTTEHSFCTQCGEKLAVVIDMNDSMSMYEECIDVVEKYMTAMKEGKSTRIRQIMSDETAGILHYEANIKWDIVESNIPSFSADESSKRQIEAVAYNVSVAGYILWLMTHPETERNVKPVVDCSTEAYYKRCRISYDETWQDYINALHNNKPSESVSVQTAKAILMYSNLVGEELTRQSVPINSLADNKVWYQLRNQAAVFGLAVARTEDNQRKYE